MSRDYPPAVRVHGIACPDIPPATLLSRLPAATIARDYPNAEPHLLCLTGSAQVGRIEVVQYPPHDYQPSSVVYPDATRALCAYCKGTHGAADALILPPGVARGVPSTRHR